MYAKITRQIYSELIKQDFSPFAINIHEDLTNDTMAINLIKLTNNIVYVICILNAYKYSPEVCVGKVQMDKANFTQKYSKTDIKFLNIFVCEEKEKSVAYIDRLEESVLLDYKDIFWVASSENSNLSLYCDKLQPNKILGIEKIIKNIKLENNEELKNDENLARITAEALINSPLRAKFMLFEFYNLIILINIVVSLYVYTTGGFGAINLLANGAYSYNRIVEHNEYYRLFTSLFLHGNFTHLFSNMLTLYVFGKGIETRTSHVNFLAIYFLSGLVANTLMLLSPSSAIMVGASGSIFGLIGAALVLTFYFNKSIYGLNFTSIATLTLLNLAVSVAVPEISFMAHFYGLIVGMVLGYFYAIDEKRSKRDKPQKI